MLLQKLATLGVKRLLLLSIGVALATAGAVTAVLVNREVRAATDRAAQMFAELGAIVEPADPGFASPFGAFWTLWTTGAAKPVSTLPADRLGELDPGLREAAESGARRSARDWLDADAVRADLGQTMAAFHRRYDLLLTLRWRCRRFRFRRT